MTLSDGSHEMTGRVVESISKVKNDSNVNMYVVLKVQLDGAFAKQMTLSDGSHEMTGRVVESISKVKNDSNVNMYVVLKVQYFLFLLSSVGRACGC